MRHFVQYHNPDRFGPYKPGGGFAIVTDKHIEKLVGDRVWLVSRLDSPRRFVLCETFIVDAVAQGRPGRKLYRVSGRDGQALPSLPVIDAEPWFRELLRATGNFAFGFEHVKSEAVVGGLMRLMRGQKEG